MLDVEHDELAGSGLQLGHRVTINDELAPLRDDVRRRPAGELLLYEDAYRTLALAVNRGSAALHLGLDLDAEVRIRAGVSALGRPRLHLRDDRRRPTTAPARWPRRARRTGRS